MLSKITAAGAESKKKITIYEIRDSQGGEDVYCGLQSGDLGGTFLRNIVTHHDNTESKPRRQEYILYKKCYVWF
jgi:hypothetical protein